MKSLLLIAAAALGTAGAVLAHDGHVHAPKTTPAAATVTTAATPAAPAELHHTVIPAEQIKWGPAPASLPPGVQAAALVGNPAQEGPFVLRLKFPAGFIVPPHRHSRDEFVTVLSGSAAILSGEKVDRSALAGLAPGSFFHLPAGMAHYLYAEKETIVHLNGMGPFDVKYINPADDPRIKPAPTQ